jgi:hypothetical protein
MALGRLDEAIARYRQAESLSTAGDIEWELAEWGLGVALDRDGQIEKSRAAIQRALDYDPTMSHLTDESVFFEPAGDKRYYEGIGHEVAGDSADALAAWRAFVVEVPGSRYVTRAQAHIVALKRVHPTAPLATTHARVTVAEIINLRRIRAVAEIHDTVQRHENELQLCYARTLRTKPSARGELRLHVILDPSGLPLVKSRVVSSTVDSPSLGQCVELTASAWRFPSNDTRDPEDLLITLEFGGK